MVVPLIIYYAVFVVWWMIVIFWGSIQKKIGFLIYPVAVLTFGFIVVMKTESKTPVELIDLAEGIKKTIAPMKAFFDSNSAMEITGYAFASAIVLATIPMLPMLIDVLKERFKKDES